MAQQLVSGGKGLHRFDYAATVKYWEDPVNYDKIIRANPIVSPIIEESHTLEPKKEKECNTDQSDYHFELISSEDMVTYPYSSVGKLFWLDVSKSDVKWCTAFYIGGGEIMTVAHAFSVDGVDCRNVHGIMFIPAMKGKQDIFGKNFGYYPVEFATVHPSYNSSDHLLTRAAYDIATCQLGQGKKLKEEVYAIGKDVMSVLQGLNGDELESKFEKSGSLLFKPIAPMSFKQHAPGNPTVWSVVGYGCSSSIDGEEGKMHKISGSKVPYYNMEPGQSLDSNKILAMNLLTQPGMNGSPWLVKSVSNVECQANGCQALSDPTARMSLTARFTSGLLREFGLM